MELQFQTCKQFFKGINTYESNVEEITVLVGGAHLLLACFYLTQFSHCILGIFIFSSTLCKAAF